jgi:thimet oligopeptidase
VPYDYQEGEITALCEAALAKAEAALAAIPLLPPAERTFANTVLALEDATSVLSEELLPLNFLGYVSTDEGLRDEAYDCETQFYQYYFEIYARVDLYEAIKDAVPGDAGQTVLLETLLGWFEGSGLDLPEQQRAELAEVMNQIADLESTFNQNLAEDTSTLTFTPEELAGVSEDFLGSLEVDGDGNFVVGTDYTQYVEVIQTATNPETRRLMALGYNNRGGLVNTELMQDTLELRQAAAELLGFDNWADYQIDGRMAGTTATARDFLESLQVALKPRLQSDLEDLLAYKQELDSEATKLDPWDISFLAYKLSQRDYSFDPEALRDYFPAATVQAGLFSVFGDLFNIDFEEVEDANVWAPGVKLYRILDRSSGEVLAYTFTDFEAREGKYGWFAMFELRGGRLVDGVYQPPISGILGSFSPAIGDKPSLLYLDEVETLFHEFGHVMHSALSRVPYASLGMSGVAWDFVEMPSQLMESFPFKKEVLGRLSGLYSDPAQKLPDELLDKALASRGFNLGWQYSRQLLQGLFDLEIHTTPGPVDVTLLYDQMYQETLGLEPLAGGHFPGTFDHLMGAYDAGYYGYLWAEVISMDAFSVFEEAGVFDATTGDRLRRMVLERGAMEDPNVLMEDFLNRPQSSQRFLQKLGLDQD